MWHSTLPWRDPLNYASGIDSEEDFVLLYSGLQTAWSGRFSYLAFKKEEEITSDNFSALEKSLSSNKDKFENAWFGYIGYEMRHALEEVPRNVSGYIKFPPMWMARFKVILTFDHHNKTVELWASDKKNALSLQAPGNSQASSESSECELGSNMTKAEYLNKVGEIKQALERGDCYQANLTRKFFGRFENKPSPIAIFQKLAEKSPAPYSALIKNGDKWIISSSPERFLNIDEKGNISTRPIKGSAPRFADDRQKDEHSKQNLKSSEKDRAENLMIVDLMRNDLSRCAKSGSVKTHDLFKVHSYETVHHMDSHVTAEKKEDKSTIDIVRSCFPPGSMTGTPKIKAMEICSKLEPQERGVYSGAIGWFGGDGSSDLSVVIRTLLIEGDKFEFQTGGAIVADSDPELEWKETLIKARGILATLGIEESILARL